MRYPSWKNASLKEKTVVVRSALDVRLENGKPGVNEKFRQAAKSIQTMLNERAKLVILAHQGHDEKEATTLKEHATLLGELTGKKVGFASWSEDWKQRVRSLRAGEALLLENVRMLKEEKAKVSAEEHANAPFVKELSSLADCFIQDDFTTCHRGHASMVGFAKRLPSYLGPCAEREVEALEKASSAPKPRLLIVGGAKAEDSLEVLKHMLENHKADRVLCGGVIGELFQRAQGVSFGAKDAYLDEFIEKEGMLEPLQKTLKSFGERIVLPTDFAFSRGHRHNALLGELPVEESVFDIGEQTQQSFALEIAKAGSVFWNGPMGKFEESEFQQGTKSVMKAIEESKAFSVVGGGDTTKAIEKLGGNKQRYGHVSIAGGALLDYLAGKNMPGLEALEKV